LVNSALSPFSGEALTEIKARSHGRCEITGKTDRPLQCLHFNHDKSNPIYNTPENGIRGIITLHLAQHLYYQEQPHLIGLKRCTNDYAIQKLNADTVAFFYKINHLEVLKPELIHCVQVWHGFAERKGLPIVPNYEDIIRRIA
jgi:hypothetical protein